jgi:hypothetical protein
VYLALPRRWHSRHALVFVIALLTCALALPAEDKLKADRPTAPEQPPLFGNEYLGQRGVTALLGTSLYGAGPLQQASVLIVGESQGVFEFQLPLLRGEDRTPVGAAAVILGCTSGHAAALNAPLFLQAGDFADCWSLEDSLGVRPLDRHILAMLRDGQPLPEPGEKTLAAVEESYLLHDALLKVLRSSDEQFRLASVENIDPEVLQNHPTRYRGKVIRFYGEVKYIREREAPPRLRQAGAKGLFEVWVLVPVAEVPQQVCLLTPLLPAGLKAGVALDIPPSVVLTGYFFKNHRIPLGSGIPGQPGHTAPLLIGRVQSHLGLSARSALGALAILGAGVGSGAVGEINAFLAGEQAMGWTIYDPSGVPPLDYRYLHKVRDNKPLPTGAEENDDLQPEALAYYDAVIKATDNPTSRFLRSVRDDVTYMHLHTEPKQQRGRVVKIEGRLRRVWRFDPMVMLQQKGVKDLYEVWLYRERFGDPNPAVLLCTSLPEGIKVTEEVKGDVHVTFVGYFFKRYRYKSPDTKKPNEYRTAPLLIGHVILGSSKPKPAESGWANRMLVLFFGIIAATFAIIFLMTWIFRRADTRLQTQLTLTEPEFTNVPEVPREQQNSADDTRHGVTPPVSSGPAG